MVTIACPHQDAAPRRCNGCDQDTTGAGWRYCEGVLELGDDGEDSTCGCNLTDVECEAARARLIDSG
jgi:hypothetical protein